ncbi:hypothetical protein H6501_00315 [Candidatus Woesearchaeota archaeon]|nr:hypothetical protein [Nanoarchaeota archaeon]MCB9370026.1 hypothetical protein [Candidatus Woesearchaeota archaeon]USN44559.1 MAG: hypothetical protein H6500_01785 [Candidatus Woesearchaeota archaeon]
MVTGDKGFFHVYEQAEISELKIKVEKGEEVFLDANAKKIATKLKELLLRGVRSKAGAKFLGVHFLPVQSKVAQERQNLLFSLPFFQLTSEDFSLLSRLQALNTHVRLPYEIFVLNNDIFCNLLYDEYRIKALSITEKELKEILEGSERQDLLLVSSEYLHADVDQVTEKEFLQLVCGALYRNHETLLLDLVAFAKRNESQFGSVREFAQFFSDGIAELPDLTNFEQAFEKKGRKDVQEALELFSSLPEFTSHLNKELQKSLEEERLSLGGKELLKLLETGDTSALQKHYVAQIKGKVMAREGTILETFKKAKISVSSLFESYSYPLTLDEESLQEIQTQIQKRERELERESFQVLGKHSLGSVLALFDFAFFTDIFFALKSFMFENGLERCSFKRELVLRRGRSLLIKNPIGITYGLGTKELVPLKGEKIALLTGANSGGKTTLLELLVQCQVLAEMGLGIPCEDGSSVLDIKEIIYLKKFSGTVGSGAFEQTMRKLLEILDTNTDRLLLIDEFEAITEPGAAAAILVEFLFALLEKNCFCVGVSHLGKEILEILRERNEEGIRLDGISASGLDDKGQLVTNHQPLFYSLGLSTPELILQRVLQDETFWKGKQGQTKETLERICKKIQNER